MHTTTVIQNQDSIPFELIALNKAKRYQSWVFETIQPFIGNRILEIGAGIGNMSNWLPSQELLVLTESDPVLYPILLKQMGAPNDKIQVRQFNVLHDQPEPFIDQNFDTIVSFNVMEHIENDKAALKTLCRILCESKAPGTKRLVTFVPAHQWAYGSLDKVFGHFRRYSAEDMKKIAREVAPEAKLTVQYFNTFGLFGWILTGRILKKTNIGLGSIRMFELLCPILRPLDYFLHQVLRIPMGQSIYAVLEWN